MRKLLFFLFALSITSGVKAQVVDKYWIVFKDKNNSPYSISTPSAFLSQRAIYRRTKYNIPVKLNDLPPNPAYIDSVIAKGATLFNRCGWLNAISIGIAVSDTGIVMPKVRALPFVQTNRMVTMVKPKKGKGKKPFTLHPSKKPMAIDSANYGEAYNQAHMIKVDCLNEMGYRGKGKQIAIIDTRFGTADKLPAFDSVRTRGQILGSWDFVWEIPKVYDDSNSDTHGEMVFSCIAGNLPGQMVGDAVDADFYLLRSEDLYSESMFEDDNWASAAEYADSAGADIITSSLGYNTFDDANNNYTYSDMNGRTTVASIAATIAAEKGMVVCIAAGNDGGDSWQYIDSPADADSVLTVGAVDDSGSYASFSSTGPTADGRIKPDVVAQGDPAAVAWPTGGVNTDYGTSFATPITAGAVASLWQADTNASNMQIIAAIKKSASQYATPDNKLGYGIPNYCNALTILTGITENKSVSALVKTYPDPFIDNITLSFYSTYTQNLTISLYNMLGQVVYQKVEKSAVGGNTKITIGGLENLSKGIYLVALTDSKGITYTQKEVKQ
ncbi:MAG TPA: S8/S53 family peptidase [Bacteroidia bacterium]|jgi:serine protease AprX|nr:S8/S53 family peptidase [Bacteroidia bacterium]